MSFVHLHSHSEYSMLDGASRIPEMFAKAAELGMPALGLTDHGVMYGAIPFYLEGKRTGVKPIVGMEAYVAPSSRFDRPAHGEQAYYHLTMLATGRTGYRNLMRMSSLGFLEGYDSRWRRPRLDKELLAAHSEGIVVLSGCLSGELAKALTAGRSADAERVAAFYKEVFGDRYFLEVQNHGIAGQRMLNDSIADIGQRLGVPLVATNDSHYTHKEDAEAHDILLCIQTGKEVSDTSRLRFDTDEFYLKSTDEMRSVFGAHPQAVENTLLVAELCDLEIELGNLLLPVFEVPRGENVESYLRKETDRGARRRYGSLTPEIEQRIERELRVIEETGFSGYFLVVADFVGWAKSNGIRVGPGRGSVGASIVAYALGITELDPLRWKLPFERFLNPGRKQMPDIDIDFDERRRGEVIKYVADKYGADRVAQIITFSTIKAKAAIRDAARVLGFAYAVGDRLAKAYPPAVLGKEAPFAACFDKDHEWPKHSGRNEAYGGAAELRRAYEEDEVARQVINTARKLEGLSRQHGVHAAGVVIGREPLIHHVPVQRTDGEMVTQYEMNALEAIGLLKMDFLGLRNLTVIEDALAHMKQNHGVVVDIDAVGLEDEKTFDLLRRGESGGVFQMESGGMTRLLRQLRPDRIEEIAALIALYRPGPMDEIPRYVSGKHSPESVAYFHPLLQEALADTYGVIVYQEQVTEMLQIVAGFDAQSADMVRFAISKKKSDVLAGWKSQFDEGCRSRGLTEDEARGLWDLILPFAGYSFNRAHANGYALIAYQTAYLKAHYPVEYMAALLTSVKNNNDKLPIYLQECRSMGIKVLPPSVNGSDLDFTPRGGEILFGLSAVRNVGEAVAQNIISARRKGDPFSTLPDFCRRVEAATLNKKVIESLAKSGAFDCLGVDRRQLLQRSKDGLEVADPAMRLAEAAVAEKRWEDAGQFSLFAGAPSSNGSTPPGGLEARLEATDLMSKELLSAEKEMLGFYVSDHPLAGFDAALRYQADCDISGLAESQDGSIRTVGGIITGLVRKFTKKGEQWYVGTMEDLKGMVDVNFWPKTVNEAPPGSIVPDSIVLVTGRVEVRDEVVRLSANRVSVPDLSKGTEPLRIAIPAADCTPDRLEELKGVLSAHPGPSPVLIHLKTSERTTVLKLGVDFAVELRGGLFAELRSVLGSGALLD